MKKKRLYSILLMIVMICTCIPGVAFAGTVDLGLSDEGISAQAVETIKAEAGNNGAESDDTMVSKIEDSTRPPESDLCGSVSEEASATSEDVEQGKSDLMDDEDTEGIAIADSSWYLSDTSLSMYFDPDDYDPWVIYAYGSSLHKITVYTSDSDVARIGAVEYQGYYGGEYEYKIELYRSGGGSAYITVYDQNNDYRQCYVTSEATPYKINAKTLRFNKKNPYNSNYIYNYYYGSDREIVSAKSSNKKVATVNIEYGNANVTAKRSGTATITVTDNIGTVSKVKVIVSKSWYKANLKYNAYCKIQYENRVTSISSKPGSKVKLRIGGKTYSRKVGKKGYVKIKLKKHYKLKTKYRVTYKYKGHSYVQKGKVNSYTWAQKTFVCGSNNYVQISVYNATRGDSVIIKVGGKKYKKKIGWSGNGTVYIYPKVSLRYNRVTELIVRNKYKQTLYRKKY